jgi:hypothetical protein
MNLSLSLNSLSNLRESNLLAESKVVREKKKYSSNTSNSPQDKKDDAESSLMQSQSLNTNLTIINSSQTQGTLLTNASSNNGLNTGEQDKKITKSMEPMIEYTGQNNVHSHDHTSTTNLPNQVGFLTSTQKLSTSRTFKKPEENGEINLSKISQKNKADKGTKKVHFAEEDFLSESSNPDTFDSDGNSEVWFNDNARTTMLNDFFENEENIIEFVITIFALIKYFNKSYYITIIHDMPEPEEELLETHVSKICDELSNQISQNQLDNNMAESNYLIVIQRDLEDTQIRLGETERLLKQQQKEYTDLEIDANNLIRKFEECEHELEVMRRINDMMQEEIEQGGIKFDEIKYVFIFLCILNFYNF